MDPALVAIARRTKGFMPDAEGDALYAAAFAAASTGLGPLAEIGAYCGKSSVYLGAGVAAARSTVRERASAVLFSVDHHRGSEENQAGWEHHDPDLADPVTGRVETLVEWRATITASGLDACVVGVVGESAIVAAHWRTPLALLFIDGGHGEEPAWADYRGWAPHVALGGVLAIHDVFPDPADGGRPPYDIYRRALESGAFGEESAEGSLRVLRRVADGL